MLMIKKRVCGGGYSAGGGECLLSEWEVRRKKKKKSRWRDSESKSVYSHTANHTLSLDVCLGLWKFSFSGQAAWLLLLLSDGGAFTHRHSKNVQNIGLIYVSFTADVSYCVHCLLYFIFLAWIVKTVVVAIPTLKNIILKGVRRVHKDIFGAQICRNFLSKSVPRGKLSPKLKE